MQPSDIATAVDRENNADADETKLGLVCLHDAYFTQTAWQSPLWPFLDDALLGGSLEFGLALDHHDLQCLEVT
jgi:hypothetical protein